MYAYIFIYVYPLTSLCLSDVGLITTLLALKVKVMANPEPERTGDRSGFRVRFR